MVADGGERGADFGDLLELARSLAELFLELVGALFLIEELERAADRAQQQWLGGVLRQVLVRGVFSEPFRRFAEAHADDRRARTELHRRARAVEDLRIDEHDAERRVADEELIETVETPRLDGLARERIGITADRKVLRVQQGQRGNHGTTIIALMQKTTEKRARYYRRIRNGSTRESSGRIRPVRILIETNEAAAERRIARLIAEMQPVIDTVLARFTRTRTLVTREDAEDIVATIQLRLVLKLRAAEQLPGEPIHNLRSYVAALAYNAVNDHLRKRFPEHARLKTRLRYALTHDARFALWPSPEGTACGLAAWAGREDAIGQLTPETIEHISRDSTAEALQEVFAATGGPVLLEAIVDAFAEAWHVVDRDPASIESIEHPATGNAGDLDFARALWGEIHQLPPMQRKALLLNLRYGGETNIVSLLVLARIARFDEIAEALEMTRGELAAIWGSLPMEDAKIAERFGLRRQQIINLRKSARERLWRRLRR